MKAVALAVVIAMASTARADVLATQIQRVDDCARHRRRIIAVITGGLGAATFTVGVIHGIGAFVDWHHLEHSNRCDAHHVCNADGVRLTDRANSLGRASDLLIGAGLLVAGGAVVIWLTAPDARIVPVVEPTGAGAMLRGQF
ncbi:MAG TPA: hypothetical protein VGO00_26290 [Kofleriaceae bacterium]|jgi:hypothetical protein|nr:hypothetical protein [Kofleriaceae bacterium]